MEQQENDVMVRRQVKDRVFTLLFSTKEAQLELYNAMNGTSYTECDELEVATLEDAIYLSMKNDVSFLLHNKLSFYEQQSTINPNMPLRQLFYVTEQYKKMVKGKWVYGSTQVALPNPQFIVLYNGVRKAPEKQVLRLSDAYYDVGRENEAVALELITTVININHGHNDTMKTRSTLLKEYGQFVDAIHKYQKDLTIQEATKKAIDVCIQNGILEDFLRRERDAVMTSILFEYNEEETLAYIAEEQYGIGKQDGEKAGKEIGQEIGKEIERVELIRKKVQKSKPFEVIASELECTQEEIRPLYDAVLKCGVGASVEEVLKEVQLID